MIQQRKSPAKTPRKKPVKKEPALPFVASPIFAPKEEELEVKPKKLPNAWDWDHDRSKFYDTGKGFLLRLNQTLMPDGRIMEMIDTEDGGTEPIPCFTPPIPKDITKVRNYGLPKWEQRFQRTKEPDFIKFENIAKVLDSSTGRIKDFTLDERQNRYRELEEDKIWITGEWQFIQGVLTWIPGIYYGELNYWNINIPENDGFKEYRDEDRKYYMNWINVEESMLEIGVVEPKFRRKGATERGCWKKFFYSRSGQKMNTGFMSDNGDKAKKEFQEKVIGPYNRLPLWLRLTDMIAPDASRIMLSYRYKGKIVGTGSTMDYRNTTIQAYNGAKIGYILIDETGKYDISLEDLMGVVKRTIMLGGETRKVGHIYAPSTVEDSRGMQFKTLVDDSKRSTYNSVLRRTASGLRLYFVPAYKGLENFIDPWGDNIETAVEDPEIIEWRKAKGHAYPDMGARDYINLVLADYAKQNKWDKYNSFKRAHPTSLADLFLQESGHNGFNSQKLQLLLVRIASTQSVKQIIRRGRFVPRTTGGVGPVYWMDDDLSGPIQCTWFFDDYVKDANHVDWNQRYPRPLNADLGAIGYDPYQKGIVLDGRNGSKGAGIGLRFFDYNNEMGRYIGPGIQRPDYRATPYVFMQYIDRPMDIEDSYRDIMYACIYFGMRLAHENNHDGVTKFFHDNGMQEFLIPESEFHPEEDQKPAMEGRYGFHMDSDAPVHLQPVYAFINGRQDYLRGFTYEIEDDIMRHPFRESIEDFMAFNLQKRKVHDLTMAHVPVFKLMETKFAMLARQGSFKLPSDFESAFSFG